MAAFSFTQTSCIGQPMKEHLGCLLMRHMSTMSLGRSMFLQHEMGRGYGMKEGAKLIFIALLIKEKHGAKLCQLLPFQWAGFANRHREESSLAMGGHQRLAACTTPMTTALVGNFL
jgi:hypothetical protein